MNFYSVCFILLFYVPEVEDTNLVSFPCLLYFSTLFISSPSLHLNPPPLPPPGSNPSVSKGSQVVVTFGDRHGSTWSGQILEKQGVTVTLGITPTANAIVGKFRTYVAIVSDGGMQRTSRDTTTDLYLLVNAWSPGTNSLLPSSG